MIWAQWNLLPQSILFYHCCFPSPESYDFINTLTQVALHSHASQILSISLDQTYKKLTFCFAICIKSWALSLSLMQYTILLNSIFLYCIPQKYIVVIYHKKNTLDNTMSCLQRVLIHWFSWFAGLWKNLHIMILPRLFSLSKIFRFLQSL